jgi:methylated-DNA-[protein]-cysteine S-methyltransferase
VLMKCETFWDQVSTPYGFFQIEANRRGVTRVKFPSENKLKPSGRNFIPSEVRNVLTTAKQFVSRYFSGLAVQNSSVVIDWRAFSSFEKNVLKQLQRVPRGKRISYGALGRKSGYVKAGRAVGNVCKKNPVPILIPCHRVIRGNSELGGFQKGVRWKKQLLKLDQN